LLWGALALAVRVAAGIVFAEPLERALAEGIGKDAKIGYLPFAHNLLERGELSLTPGKPEASHVPGFPLLLAGAIALAGNDDRGVSALGLAAGALAVGLLFLLGDRLAGPRVGHLAGLAGALSPDLVAYSLLALSETPHLVCELAASLCILRALRTGERRAAAALGLALAASVMMREGSFALAGIWAAALLGVRPGGWRRRWRAPAIALAIVFAALVPWWLRNWAVMGEFIPFTTKGSYTFYEGTLIRAYPPADHRNRDLVLPPEEAAREADVHRRKAAARSWAERDRVLIGAGLANIERDPLGQFAHLGRKLVWLWSPNIGPRHADRVGAAPALYAAAGLHFAALGLGLLGLWRSRRSRDVMVVLALPLLVTTALHLLVSGAEPRYHFSAWPALLIGSSLVLEPWAARATAALRSARRA
jgi:4-amino-4-deoxy-L-arabinose transferase-like glycosyltransferase